MNITFIKDCPAIVESGNSAYKKGDEATLRLGKRLIDLGYAREGWGDLISNPFSDMTVKEMKQFAIDMGVELPKGKKAELAEYLFKFDFGNPEEE